MIRFECDYLEDTHPKILEFLTKTNFEQTPGYGNYIYCEKACSIIKTMNILLLGNIFIVSLFSYLFTSSLLKNLIK